MSGVTATLSIRASDVELAIASSGGVERKTISEPTDRPLSVSVVDYNYDGYRDFAISHVDDGMGTYEIYDIYVFSPQLRRFILLRPGCGDQFVNVRLLKKERVLINSYFSENRYKSCKMRF